jgi:hypothetical protein
MVMLFAGFGQLVVPFIGGKICSWNCQFNEKSLKISKG